MKKIGIVLCLFIFVFSLSACSSSKDNPLHLGVNAVITEIDVANKTITVKDSAEEGVLGENCLIDCSSIPMIYCDYDTQQVVSISFKDLQVKDEILLSIRSSEIENFQNKDNEESTIKVEQLQLGTQRIK
ncbi:hypothetical protein [Enterocloster citroniae]|uniref:hypothetical protein n=1 Tax=Enterocloster citroniae TaxID=358743 RepID=UPI00349E7197